MWDLSVWPTHSPISTHFPFQHTTSNPYVWPRQATEYLFFAWVRVGVKGVFKIRSVRTREWCHLQYQRAQQIWDNIVWYPLQAVKCHLTWTLGFHRNAHPTFAIFSFPFAFMNSMCCSIVGCLLLYSVVLVCVWLWMFLVLWSFLKDRSWY